MKKQFYGLLAISALTMGVFVKPALASSIFDPVVEEVNKGIPAAYPVKDMNDPALYFQAIATGDFKTTLHKYSVIWNDLFNKAWGYPGLLLSVVLSCQYGPWENWETLCGKKDKLDIGDYDYNTDSFHYDTDSYDEYTYDTYSYPEYTDDDYNWSYNPDETTQYPNETYSDYSDGYDGGSDGSGGYNGDGGSDGGTGGSDSGGSGGDGMAENPAGTELSEALEGANDTSKFREHKEIISKKMKESNEYRQLIQTLTLVDKDILMETVKGLKVVGNQSYTKAALEKSRRPDDTAQGEEEEGGQE